MAFWLGLFHDGKSWKWQDGVPATLLLWDEVMTSYDGLEGKDYTLWQERSTDEMRVMVQHYRNFTRWQTQQLSAATEMMFICAKPVPSMFHFFCVCVFF